MIGISSTLTADCEQNLRGIEAAGFTQKIRLRDGALRCGGDSPMLPIFVSVRTKLNSIVTKFDPTGVRST